jgi:hypothetical protein
MPVHRRVSSLARLLLPAFIVLVPGLALSVARAAEGMWTLDNLPLAALEREYGFTPDAPWLDRARGAPVRLAGGCSGSFVSPSGLVLTNHHCVRDCVQQLSTGDQDYMARGFLARDRARERRCPGMELNRLTAITDVTAEIQAATRGQEGAAWRRALDAASAKLTGACTGGRPDTVRCDLVTLYGGARWHLYRYDRFQDVRLVFVPEEAVAFFGGDPDNFNFPRWNLDAALLRAWQNGKPVKARHWFPVNPTGPGEGELTFTLGHPGATDRQLTVAQLIRRRDLDVISGLLRRAELRGILTEFGRTDPERARVAATELMYVENSLKADRGYLEALLNPALLAARMAEEVALQEYLTANPALALEAGEPWVDMARAQEAYRGLATRWRLLERGGAFYTTYFNYARLLVRGGAERERPDGERLPEFSTAALPAVRQRLEAAVPLHPELETVKLTWSLTQLREQLGTDDPLVQAVLGRESPRQVAGRLVAGTSLGDPAVRRALWEGGAAAVAASRDPFIVLARDLDAPARALRARYEAEVEAVERRAADRIARVRFARTGTTTYPDATFSLRLSYGEVRGWTEGERQVPPFTDLAGAFRRHTGSAPYALPATWLEGRNRLRLDQPYNFVSTHDITGGNSGSPVINRRGELVGLIFDGNIHSLAGDLWYDGTQNRAVSVHAGAIVVALEKLYDAGHLIREMQSR